MRMTSRPENLLGAEAMARSLSQNRTWIVDQVARYIAQQEEHHRMRTFAEELRGFIDRHGLRWMGDESR